MQQQCIKDRLGHNVMAGSTRQMSPGADPGFGFGGKLSAKGAIV